MATTNFLCVFYNFFIPFPPPFSACTALFAAFSLWYALVLLHRQKWCTYTYVTRDVVLFVSVACILFLQWYFFSSPTNFTSKTRKILKIFYSLILRSSLCRIKREKSSDNFLLHYKFLFLSFFFTPTLTLSSIFFLKNQIAYSFQLAVRKKLLRVKFLKKLTTFRRVHRKPWNWTESEKIPFKPKIL